MRHIVHSVQVMLTGEIQVVINDLRREAAQQGLPDGQAMPE